MTERQRREIEKRDLLCVLCRHARARGNGFAFSYSPAEYMPRGVA